MTSHDPCAGAPEGATPAPRGRQSPKIRDRHLDRPAVVYVRQSSPHQVRGHRESAVRQYALVDRAKALGWPAAAVQTIDEDQGRSAVRSDHRDGFKRLLAEIGAGQVGLVLALEASRLARSSVDWHRLVEIRGITKTLLADESAVYDPRDPNDRLRTPFFMGAEDLKTLIVAFEKPARFPEPLNRRFVLATFRSDRTTKATDRAATREARPRAAKSKGRKPSGPVADS